MANGRSEGEREEIHRGASLSRCFESRLLFQGLVIYSVSNFGNKSITLG